MQSGRAIVALESAVVTSGLLRKPLASTSKLQVPHWDRSQPVNLELARALHRVVRAASGGGCVPTMVAVLDGRLRIGLEDDELVMLADEKCAGKASSGDLAAIMARGGSAGTTVSATLTAIALAHQSKIQNPKSKMLTFATGGIGGVHRNWQMTPDISADLRAIATTPVCIVCSGAKSILDLPATLEMLETLGVPVVGYRTDCFPQFQCLGDESLKVPARFDDVNDIAKLCKLHWETLGQRTGIILANPPPEEFALTTEEMEAAIRAAEDEASARGITGAARTPFLLDDLAKRTAGRSLDANIALLLSNAKLAAELATVLANE